MTSVFCYTRFQEVGGLGGSTRVTSRNHRDRHGRPPGLCSESRPGFTDEETEAGQDHGGYN